jgi:hypothetical protein
MKYTNYPSLRHIGKLKTRRGTEITSSRLNLQAIRLSSWTSIPSW